MSCKPDAMLIIAARNKLLPQLQHHKQQVHRSVHILEDVREKKKRRRVEQARPVVLRIDQCEDSKHRWRSQCSP